MFFHTTFQPEQCFRSISAKFQQAERGAVTTRRTWTIRVLRLDDLAYIRTHHRDDDVFALFVLYTYIYVRPRYVHTYYVLTTVGL